MNDYENPRFVGSADVDFKVLHFGPKVQDSGKKRVEIFADDKSMDNKNKVKILLNADEDVPMETRFPLDKEQPTNADPSRRGFTVKVLDEKALKALHAFDERVLEMAVLNSKEWFGKVYTADQVKLRYMPVVKKKIVNGVEDDFYSMSFKVKCTGSKVPPPIMVTQGVTHFFGGTEEVLKCASAKINQVLVSAFSVWFMAGDQFGVSFQADKMLVTKGAIADPMAGLSTKRKLTQVPNPDEESARAMVLDEYAGEDDNENLKAVDDH